MGGSTDWVDDAWDGISGVWDDVVDWTEETIAEEVFGMPSEEEQAQQAAAQEAAMAEAGRVIPSNAMDIRGERKKRLAEIRARAAADKAGALSEQRGKSAGIVAGMRSGSGGIRSTKGSDKQLVRARKFKESRPLKIGMKRP